MKTRAMLMAGVMALTVMATTRVARAQDRVVANIPFDFAVGDTKLPAGEYTVRISEVSKMLVLTGEANPNASLIIPANNAESSDVQTKTKLVFHCYGDRYFLSQLWIAGRSSGKQLLKSKSEKEMATLAKVETQGQVTLYASLR